MKLDHTDPAIQRGHKSAQSLYPMHECERCGKPGVHSHGNITKRYRKLGRTISKQGEGYGEH